MRDSAYDPERLVRLGITSLTPKETAYQTAERNYDIIDETQKKLIRELYYYVQRHGDTDSTARDLHQQICDLEHHIMACDAQLAEIERSFSPKEEARHDLLEEDVEEQYTGPNPDAYMREPVEAELHEIFVYYVRARRAADGLPPIPESLRDG